MPCVSYDTEWVHTHPRRSHTEIALKSECDRLARIACKAMYALEKIDPELKSFKDQESRKWWAKHKKDDQARIEKAQKEKAKKEAEEKLRREALAKLTPEEIMAFGLDKKGKK